MFAGFGAEALPFFKALGFHQSREWFTQNKDLYETEVKTPLGDLVEDLTATFAKAKIPLMGDRRKSLFRIHRDVRFAKNKALYKTNGGAVLNRDGTKGTGGMLYIHIDPEGCFVAAGWYMPEPATLAGLRAAIAKSPKVFQKMEAALAAKGLPIGDGHVLKRTPKGFETIDDIALVHAVRRTNLIVRRDLDHAELGNLRLLDTIVTFTRDALPLLNFGWKATA